VKSKLKPPFVVILSICCAFALAAWLGAKWWPQHAPQDFEKCSEQAEKTAASVDERTSLMDQCDKQFAGRRKMGGGYTYHDFLQNRHFDIAGPNPTPTEQKYFDEQYTVYLGAQRRDAAAADLAETPTQIAQPNSRNEQVTSSITSPGPPMVLAPPRIPIPRARSSVVRSRDPCEEASISCTWTKFSAGIKNFFESNAQVTSP
jgi:hypothetical protein